MPATPHASRRSRESHGPGLEGVITGRRLATTLPALLLLLAAAPAPAAAQEPDALALFLEGLDFREIGPAAMGGRVADIAADERRPATFYIGFATGGVWKTTNHGASFEPVFDDQPTSTIGDVTLAPSNPDVVWVGTGEPQNRQSSPYGFGVFRSLDGGKTWSHLGLKETRHIARIQVHPRDPDVAYVAAVGHLWGANPERGVYRTMDGGRSWDKVLFIDDNTGAIDLAMDPEDPSILYAAMYQRRRTNFGFNGGGPGSGIWRTRDGGDTWVELTNGLPEKDKGRIGLDIYRGDPRMVFAIVEGHGDEEGIYRSADRGDTWEKRSDTNPRPMYYSQIRVDPSDPERVYLGGTSFYISSDGARTFEDFRWEGVHVDHHALWVDPNDGDHLILGNDGGVYASFDRGASWRMYDNMALGQFYEIGVDMAEPYNVCGGLQDNGTWCGPSDARTSNGIINARWRTVNGGDGFYARLDPTDAGVLYAESQNGNLARVDLEGHERQSIRPTPKTEWTARFADEDDADLRFNWNSPVLISHHDPKTIYYGANVLFRSRDQGLTWEQLSGDLTKAIDRDTLRVMGVALSSDSIHSRNDGISSFGNATSIDESPLDENVLYYGADDGNLQVSRDGGATWTNVVERIPDLPSGTYVSRVRASRHAPGRVYATFDGHYNDDYAPHVYVSEDYGRSWRRIVDGLPSWSVNAFAEHPRDPDLLFVGNEIGVYVSTDRGAGWTRMPNVPTAPVDDIALHPRDNDLVLGTHGRSVWILDDVFPLESVDSRLLASAAHLFPVDDVTAWNTTSWEPVPAGSFTGENPARGAVIRYWLGRDVAAPAPAVADAAENGDGGAGSDARRRPEGEGKVTLEVVDARGNVIRTLEGPGERGLHEVRWDLRLEPPYDVPESERRGRFGGPRGPQVLPGTFRVRLAAGGAEQSDAFEVRWDPRVETTPADLQARFDAAMVSYRLAEPLYIAGQRIDSLQSQLGDLRRMLRGRADVPAELRARVDSLVEEVDELEDSLDDVGGDIRRGGFGAEGSSRRPTEDQTRMLEAARAEAPGLIRRLNEILTEDVPAVYGRLNELGIRPRVGGAVPVPG